MGIWIYAPLLRHNILTEFPVSGRVSASRVGAKNMASSSGCAIRRQMRLLRRLGNRIATENTMYGKNKQGTTSRPNASDQAIVIGEGRRSTGDPVPAGGCGVNGNKKSVGLAARA